MWEMLHWSEGSAQIVEGAARIVACSDNFSQMPRISQFSSRISRFSCRMFEKQVHSCGNFGTHFCTKVSSLGQHGSYRGRGEDVGDAAAERRRARRASPAPVPRLTVSIFERRGVCCWGARASLPSNYAVLAVKHGAGCGVQGAGCGVQGAGFRV